MSVFEGQQSLRSEIAGVKQLRGEIHVRGLTQFEVEHQHEGNGRWGTRLSAFSVANVPYTTVTITLYIVYV